MEEWIDAPRTEVDIRQRMVVQDALRAANKRRFDPFKLIKVIIMMEHFLINFNSFVMWKQVCFVGECAVDTGGPAREFWRLLMFGMEQNYCRSGDDGCFFDRNVPALQVFYWKAAIQ